jgi:uncharacterized integral membrane protein
MENADLTICQYLSGLALVAIAVAATSAWRKTDNRQTCDHRQTWLWLALLGLTQGATAWSDVLAALLGPSRIASGLQVVVWAASCVALVEFGQRRFEPDRAWLLRRWAYAVLGPLALLGIACGRSDWLAYEYRGVLAWQGGVTGITLCLQSLAKPQRKLSLALDVAVAAMLVYLGAICFQIIPLSTLAALVAVTCAWLSHRQSPRQRAHLGWLRECLGPAAFLLIAAAGWLVLTRSQETSAQFALVGSMETEHSAAPGTGTDGLDNPDGGPDGGQGVDSQDFQIVEAIAASPELRRFGMAVIPIVVFVLIIFGLSRLPAAR